MPDPELKPSDRDRLLRLIDGGPDALKEFQLELKPPKKVEPTVAPKPVSSARLLAGWRSKIPVTNQEALRLLRWILAGVAILAGLQYGLGILRTFRSEERTVPSSAASVSDETGVGLRLVGVDTSEPPVALLEDLVTGKTYFVRVNENVKNARVKKIEKNKVLVSVRGKTVELH